MRSHELSLFASGEQPRGPDAGGPRHRRSGHGGSSERLDANRRPESPGRIVAGRQSAPSTLCAPVPVNIGPNLFVAGSLAWFLWLRAARSAGARPSIAKASRLGLVAVPLSMAAARGMLALTGSH